VRLKNGTPEAAAEMVRYVNIEKGYNILYWGIGNEPTLYNGELQEGYDAARFNGEWRDFALAMQAVDPSILLVGPEYHQFSYDIIDTTNYGEGTAKDSAGRLWMDEFLKANGGLVDIVSFHRYPYPVSTIAGPPTIDELRRNAHEWDRIIVRLRELIHEHTGRDLPIAVTEFNSAYNKSVGGEATADTHYNAIWLADVLGRLIRNGVFMANQWMFTSKGGYGGWGLVGQSEVYPTYHAYQLYKMFGNELIYASSDDPDLSIYAARNPRGQLTVILINLSLEEKSKTLEIEGLSGAQAETWLFDPDHPAENTGMTNLSDIVTVPAQSMTLFVIPETR
jgi:alpha-L-arabinofuranosidase